MLQIQLLLLFLVACVLSQSVDHLSLPSLAQVKETMTDPCNWHMAKNSLPIVFSSSKLQMSTQEALSRLNTLSSRYPQPLGPFALETNLRRPAWIYTFAIYSSFAYCQSYNQVRPFSVPNAAIRGLLPTGNFMLRTWNPMNESLILGIPDIDDGLFYTAINNEQRLIVLTWRGTAKLQGVLANVDFALIPLSDEDAVHFGDNPTSNPQCSTRDPSLRVFAGFIKSMPMNVLQQVVTVLAGLRQRFPAFSVVLNGHSLGGLKAMLTAAYLTKFHSADIPISAVYTFGQPPPGNTEFNQWLAQR